MNAHLHTTQTNRVHVSVASWRLTTTLLFLSVSLFLTGCSLFGSKDKKKSSSGGDGDAPAYMNPSEPVGCTGGTVDCGGACVSTLSDSANCGGCGIACASGQYCEAGACLGFCSTGETACAGLCQLTVSDTVNCGACGVACAQGEVCDSGACSVTCSGTLCPNALGGQDCAHLGMNNDHCGACGIACAPGQECQAGACVEACPPGRAACGAGCVDIRSNAQNCGGCGVVCAAGQACVEGQCGGTPPACDGGACSCSPGQEYCNAACVDPLSNAFHCGACGVECLEGQECTGGACACVLGKTLCGDECADTRLDSENCGACGVVCEGGTTCQDSVCLCEAGDELCEGMCIDPQSDANNCGGCGIACESYEQCFDGVCKYEGDQCGGDAREIEISRVSLYQAVELDLFDEGQMVGPESRTVDVIQGRNAMARIFVTPTDAFAARELSARVFVENEGEDVQVFHHKRSVTGASSQPSLDTTFNVDIPGELIGEGTRYWIELVECGVLPEGEVKTTRVPVAPGENGEFVARQTGTIHIMFVPITHDGRTPDVNEETISAFSREVELQYPTTGVEWSVRDPIASDQSGVEIDLTATLDLVTYLKDEDGAPDELYYYGLIDPAPSFNDYCGFSCTTGVGWVTDVGSPWAASHRVAVGIGFGTAGAGTFAHELGHNHGRDHAPCNVSGEQGYPYAGGSIGVWGYNPDQQQLKDPALFADFMGYCNDNWVSDYSFNGYTERIAAVNGVSSRLQSFVHLGESSTWYRMMVTESDIHWLSPVERPGKPRPTGEVGFVYDSAGNVIETVEIHRLLMSHGEGYMVYVPEPRPGWFSVGPAGGPVLVY